MSNVNKSKLCYLVLILGQRLLSVSCVTVAARARVRACANHLSWTCVICLTLVHGSARRLVRSGPVPCGCREDEQLLLIITEKTPKKTTFKRRSVSSCFCVTLDQKVVIVCWRTDCFNGRVLTSFKNFSLNLKNKTGRRGFTQRLPSGFLCLFVLLSLVSNDN